MNSRSPSKRGEELNKVVDNVLNQILGQEATQIIYDFLETNHSIQRHEIAEKLDSFNQALEAYLGAGAVVIEKIIMENLQLSQLEESNSFDFVERQRILKLA